MTDKPKNSQQINSHDLGDSLSPTTADNNNQDKPQTLSELKELKEKTELGCVFNDGIGICGVVKFEDINKTYICDICKQRISDLSLGIQVAEEVLKNEIEWLEEVMKFKVSVFEAESVYYRIDYLKNILKEQLKEEKK